MNVTHQGLNPLHPEPAADFLISLYRSSGGLLDLDIRNGATGTGQVGSLGLGVLEVVVGDGRLDGILSKHRAVN